MTTLWQEAYLKKVVEPHALTRFAEKIKSEGKTIATLNGSFDLLHAGHLEILFAASQQADILLVALNSDKSIQAYKSPKRPIVPLRYRMEMMAAIEFVDFVTYFEETDPRTFLATVKPHVHVNGADYLPRCLEADTVESFGGSVHYVPLVPGLSTSTLLKKIQECV